MDRNSVRRRMALGLGASALLAVTAAGPALAANTVTQAITGSGLTASVADLTLASVAYQNAAHDVTGTMALTADDSTGSGAGWNVTIQSSAFVWVGTANGGTDIPAAKFALTCRGRPTMIAGQAVGAALCDRAAGPADVAHRHAGHAPQDPRRDRRIWRRHIQPGTRRHVDDPGDEPRRRLHRHAHDHDHLGSVDARSLPGAPACAAARCWRPSRCSACLSRSSRPAPSSPRTRASSSP